MEPELDDDITIPRTPGARQSLALRQEFMQERQYIQRLELQRERDRLRAFLRECEIQLTHVLVIDGAEYPHEEIWSLDPAARRILRTLWAKNYQASLR